MSNNNPPSSKSLSGLPRDEYFLPRDGIDREVIVTDICQYLGNDALIQPGTYEAPDGRMTQGYFITASRALTTAMVQDLKADSVRWEQERRPRTGSASATAGASSSRGPLRYQISETHHRRTLHGPTSKDTAQAEYGDSTALDCLDASILNLGRKIRYPGTGTKGYSGGNSNKPDACPPYAPHLDLYTKAPYNPSRYEGNPPPGLQNQPADYSDELCDAKNEIGQGR
ncbi:hypothetical protein GQ53DRAFT_533719 [Thozetella sp. PMI_491]|nr:hypothetical protein GQ53DRAFT_533719 [Thozetella sp. PMI_491]